MIRKWELPYPFSKGWESDKVNLKNGDVSVFCPDWPAQMRDARMGYRELNYRYRKSIEVEIEYDASKYLNWF